MLTLGDRIRALLHWLAGLLAPVAFLLVAASAATLAWLLLDDRKLDGTGAVGLTAVVLVAVLLASGGPDFISRIRRIGPGGVELEAWQDITRIPEMAEVADPVWGMGMQLGQERPPPLSDKQNWFYEQGTSLLFYLDHRGVDAYKLRGRELDRYRRLVVWVAGMALNQLDYRKALEMLKHIEDVPGLHYDELFHLGISYFFVAPENESEEGERRSYLQRSRRSLERAVKQPPNEAEAHWALGYIYDELEEYDLAIKENEIAIKMDSTKYHDSGYWNMAVSQLNNGNPEGALSSLEQIPSSDLWNGICEDEELAALKEHEYFSTSFDELCNARKPTAGGIPEALVGP